MINIISRAVLSSQITGPQKVVVNLVKGLDILHYPYLVNQRLDACELLYIHDDRKALEQIKYLPDNIKIIAGPNLFVTAKDIPSEIEFKNCVYIHPSKWSMEFFRDFGFNKCPLDWWPTGIDTESIKPVDGNKDVVLVYLKQRSLEEYSHVTKLLKAKNINFELIHYDAGYRQADYVEFLGRAKYVIWIGRQESQGIALQEAMAMNVPMLVWDVMSVGHCIDGSEFSNEQKIYTNTTSAPYFDFRCGRLIKDQSELSSSIDIMEKTFETYRPREYVLENLSLEKQANDLLKIYNKYFGVDVDESFKAPQLAKGKWKNDKLLFRFYLRNKQIVKKVFKIPGNYMNKLYK